MAAGGQDHQGWSRMLLSVKVVSQYDSLAAVHWSAIEVSKVLLARCLFKVFFFPDGMPVEQCLDSTSTLESGHSPEADKDTSKDGTRRNTFYMI